MEQNLIETIVNFARTKFKHNVSSTLFCQSNSTPKSYAASET